MTPSFFFAKNIFKPPLLRGIFFENAFSMVYSEKERKRSMEDIKKLKRDLKQCKYELGRYQKRAADLSKVVKELQETIEGYTQREDINMAMIAAVIEQTGPVAIGRDRISEILDDDTHVVVDYDADKRTYTLRMMGGETDGKGTAESD